MVIMKSRPPLLVKSKPFKKALMLTSPRVEASLRSLGQSAVDPWPRPALNTETVSNTAVKDLWPVPPTPPLGAWPRG